MKTLQLILEELLNKKSSLEDAMIKVSEEISDIYLQIQEHGNDYQILDEKDLIQAKKLDLKLEIKALNEKKKEEIRELQKMQKLQVKELKRQQDLALQELKPRKITKREILEERFREKIRLEKELMEQKNNILIESIPTIIYDDLNSFLAELKVTDERMHYIAEQCSGLLPEKKTLEALAIELGRTRERNRQIYDKFFEKFSYFSRVSTELLKTEIYNRVLNLEDLEKVFAELRSMFNETASFYIFLERLVGIEKLLSTYVVKTDIPRGYYNNIIFDDYCINRKLPISIDEAKKIILDNNKCDEISAAFICFNFINKNFVKVIEGGIIPLTPSIPAMIAQACLYFENGATYEEIRKKATEIFDYEFIDINRGSKEILHATSVDYVYLYEDGGARHLSFFKQEYLDEKIDEVLNKSYSFIANTSEKSCRIKELVTSCFNDSIHYYDLRYIIKQYGDKNPQKIINFIGKSSQDIACLSE